MGQAAPQGVGAAGTPPAGDLASQVLSGVLSAVGVSEPFCFQGWTNFAAWGSIVSALTTTAGSAAGSVASGTSQAAGVAINSKLVPPGTTWATFAGTTGTFALPSITLYGYLNSAGLITGLGSTAWLTGAAVTGANIPAGATVTGIPVAAIPGQVTGSVQLSNLPTLPLPAQNTPIAVTFQIAAAAIAAGTDNAASYTGAAITFSATIQIERSFDGGKIWIVCNVGATGLLAQYSGGTPLNVAWAEPERGVLYRFNCIEYTSGTINYRMSENAGIASSIAFGGQV